MALHKGHLGIVAEKRAAMQITIPRMCEWIMHRMKSKPAIAISVFTEGWKSLWTQEISLNGSQKTRRSAGSSARWAGGMRPDVIATRWLPSNDEAYFPHF